MSFNDPVSDMLTRIRNALRNKAKTVECLNSRVCRGIADVLKSEGFIDGYDIAADGHAGKIKIKLKYGPRGEILIHTVKRESKPGCCVFCFYFELSRPLQGLGIAVVSTSKSVLSDRKCRTDKVGGELICTIE